MKKAIAKQSLRLLAAMFVLLGALAFTATRANAQAPTLPTQGAAKITPVTTTLVNQDLASQRLIDAVDAIHQILPTLIPGTVPHSDAVRHVYYYKAIVAELQGGQTVNDAVMLGLSALVGDTSPLVTNRTQLEGLYADAINLLQ